MVYDAIAEGGGGDETGLEIADGEGAIASGLLDTVDEIVAQADHFGLLAPEEGRCFRAAALAQAGAAERFPEIGPGNQLIPEVAGALHVANLIQPPDRFSDFGKAFAGKADGIGGEQLQVAGHAELKAMEVDALAREFKERFFLASVRGGYDVVQAVEGGGGEAIAKGEPVDTGHFFTLGSSH